MLTALAWLFVTLLPAAVVGLTLSRLDDGDRYLRDSRDTSDDFEGRV